MGRLTRQDKAVAVTAGILLGAAVAIVGQVLAWGLPVEAALCIIGAAGLGVLLASGKPGRW